MEPYPQSSEMEQFFAKLMTAILPMRWQVHPLPEIEAWDTESRPDVKHGCVADRASPRVLVEVHPCAGECAISVKRCPHQAERPIVIGVRLHDSDGRVSFDIFERPVVFKHIARSYICIWASVFHSFEQRLGYGITVSNQKDCHGVREAVAGKSL